MEGCRGRSHLSENPVLDGHLVLGESPGLEELVDAVDGKEPAQVGVQSFGDWEPAGLVTNSILLC